MAQPECACPTISNEFDQLTLLVWPFHQTYISFLLLVIRCMKCDDEEQGADTIQTSRYRNGQSLFDFGCVTPAVVRFLSFIDQ